MIAKINKRKSKKALLQKTLQMVKNLMKDFKVFETEKKSFPEPHQLRRLRCTYPLYFVLLDKTQFHQEFIYVCMPFSEDIELSFINEDTPVLQLPKRKTIIAGLPFWIYLTEEFLEKYSETIAKLPEEKIERLQKYVENTPFDKIGGATKEYIKDLMHLLAPYNTASFFTALEDLEAYWETPQEISLDLKTTKDLIKYACTLPASPKKALRGKNWFGIVEEVPENKAILTLYLPVDAVGKKAVIKSKGQVLFEGLLERDKLRIEFPLLPNYAFLENNLEIQI